MDDNDEGIVTEIVDKLGNKASAFDNSKVNTKPYVVIRYCVTLEELSILAGDRLTVTFNPFLKKWQCSFENGEIKTVHILRWASGFGSTPTSAMEDYAANISGETMVFHAVIGDRKEFNLGDIR
jgi:hypothetical protein